MGRERTAEGGRPCSSLGIALAGRVPVPLLLGRLGVDGLVACPEARDLGAPRVPTNLRRDREGPSGRRVRGADDDVYTLDLRRLLPPVAVLSFLSG